MIQGLHPHPLFCSVTILSMLSVLNTLVYFYHRSFPGLPMLSLCSRVRKFLSLLYRKYYQYAEPEILLQLYIYLVHPHQEYASPVWNPYLQKNINTLEDVQKFDLRMGSNCLDQAYSQLLCLNADSSLTFALCLKLYMAFLTQNSKH